MAVLFFNSDVLLSVAELRERMKELQEWQAQITALQKQVAEAQEWFNSVAKVIGPERADQLIADVLLPTQVGTSNEAIPPSEQHPRRKAIPPSGQSPRRSRIGDEVKRFLKPQTNGATSRQIIDHLLQIQEFQELVQRNSNGTVYTALSRLVERGEIRKIERSYYSPVAHPKENSGSEEGTAVSSELRGAPLSSPACHEAESRHTEVSKEQHASGGGTLTSTEYVGPYPAEVPPEASNQTLFPASPVEAPPKTPTQSLFAGVKAEVPPKTQTRSLFAGVKAEVPP